MGSDGERPGQVAAERQQAAVVTRSRSTCRREVSTCRSRVPRGLAQSDGASIVPHPRGGAARRRSPCMAGTMSPMTGFPLLLDLDRPPRRSSSGAGRSLTRRGTRAARRRGADVRRRRSRTSSRRPAGHRRRHGTWRGSSPPRTDLDGAWFVGGGCTDRPGRECRPSRATAEGLPDLLRARGRRLGRRFGAHARGGPARRRDGGGQRRRRPAHGHVALRDADRRRCSTCGELPDASGTGAPAAGGSVALVGGGPG